MVLGLDSLIAPLVAIIAGPVLIYLLRDEGRLTALGLGAPVTVIGIILLTRSLALISGFSGWIVLGSALLVLVASIYITLGRSRGMLPILGTFFVGVFVLPFIQLNFLYFPIGVIFAYLSVSLALMDSYYLSQTQVTLRRQKMGKFSGGITLPFSIIEGAIRRRYTGSRIRMSLFSGYAIFELTLFLAVPSIAVIIYSGAVAFETFSAILMAIVMLASWRISMVKGTWAGRDSRNRRTVGPRFSWIRKKKSG